MGYLRLSFTERRRARLAKKVDQLDRLESRTTITEPISFTGLSVSALRGLAELGLMTVGGGNNISSQAVREASQRQAGQPTSSSPRRFPSPTASIRIDIGPPKVAGGGGGGNSTDAQVARGANKSQADDWLSLSKPTSGSSQTDGISNPWHPLARAGGGAALPPRGGSGSGALTSTASLVRGQVTPLRLPPPASGATSSSGAFSALSAAVIGANNGNAPGAAATAPVAAAEFGSSSHSATPGPAPAVSAPSAVKSQVVAAITNLGGPPSPSSIPDPTIGNSSVASHDSFPYFPLYVLDNNNGVVLFPGADQMATLGGWVDLEAQVSGTTVSSYNWNTSGLTNVTNLSATNTYQLTFQWTGTVTTAHSVPLTLSVTDTNSHTETYTYDFWLPVGSYTSSGGGSNNAIWPQSLTPNQELEPAPAFASDGASVDATSGTLDTAIALPSYNPNVPAQALTYDSLTANPMPIIVVENTLSASGAVPSQVSAQLTFNGTALTTYYYNTSTLNPGDIQQIALQATNAPSLATGRYAYTATIVDHGTTNTTITLSGSVDLINESTSALGDGWQLQGLEQITSASGGVILNLGTGGRSLWFAGSFGSGGGTFTDQQGEFSTLVQNSGGGYTRTLTDGTQITFNSSGYETATINLNGLHTTYSYNGSNQLSTITDPYNNVTTFSYSGGYLRTIKDPASRLTTFTNSSGDLTAVEQADGSVTSYTYNSSGSLTEIKDPLSNVVTISYDSADRVSTITEPDGDPQLFTNDQEAGWTNSGTSSNPAAATLLAQATSTYTNPNGNTTTLRLDWWGMGVTGVQVDALGDVATYDLNSNGLPTVAIDQVNRPDLFTYNSLGSMTKEVYPDGNNIQYTYNSESEPLTYTNADRNTYSYTYDSHGNNTVIEDPLGNLTTMTYTSTGRVQSVTDPNHNITTYQYDSQDRLTTTINPGGTTLKYTYNNQGNETSVTDERGNTTTYGYDALNRKTGMTDALGDITTYTYDSGGNLIKQQNPTPAGQTARTTTYAYDSMERLTTVTDPLGYQTIYGYDGDGNLTSIKDPMGRITTTIYDALNRPTVIIDPMGNRTTTTYDGDNEVIQVVDPLGRITTTTYDNRGWVATVTDPLGNITTYSYTATGKAATVSAGSGGGSQAYTYDKDDRLNAYTDANDHTTTYGYDADGNQITVTDANNNTTTSAYDSRNQVTTVTSPLGNTVVYGYDADANQITVTDGLGHTTTTLYDALNRATTMISAVGGITTITYDAAGRETSETDPDGNKTQWAYDADDRMTTLTQPNGYTVTNVYDADKELIDTTDADGRRTTYSYDADGDQTGQTWVGASPSEIVTYTYDADHELTRVADSYATLTFTYDSGGNQITAATSGPGAGQPSVTLTSSYDPQHSLTSLSDNLSSAGITTYTYNSAQLLTNIAASYGGTAGPQVAITYDGANRMTAESGTIGGSNTSVTTSFSYDADDRQTTITDQSVVTHGSSGGSTTTPLATYVYSYDNANRATSETDAEGTTSFTYDNANELTGVSGSQSASYTYDLNGNRTGTGYSTGTDNEQTASPGFAYSYDKAGNLISQTNTSTDVTTTYTYDYRNRLTEVTQGGTVIATYTYDALNNRIGVKDQGTQTWTVYDGTNPYADFNGSGTLQQRYLSGAGVINGAVVDEILARTSSGGTTAWYLTDKLGSVRDIVSSSGSELDHIVYDSFGNILSETNAANGDRFKFAGMEYDSVTGTYYDRRRYYDPQTGRFISQDPKGFGAGDTDLYRYVGNNPANETDPTGTSALGDAVSAVSQFFGDYTYYFGQNVQSVYNYVYTGELNPSSEVYSAAMEAAGQSYAENSEWAHTVLSILGTIPCAGKLATITNSVLYDLEQNGYPSIGTIGSLLSYIWNVGACFGAGTPILTPHGEKPVEAFRPGDWVMTAPENSPDAAPVARRVEQVFHNRAVLFTLTVGTREILTTAEHPFWVQGRGWTPTRDLIEGDRLRSHDGQWVRVSRVEASSEKVDVYNFRVSEHHTYFVGSREWGFSVWAHNVDQCTVDTSMRNSEPYDPTEVCPVAYDPDTGTIYIGPNGGAGAGHQFMQSLPAFLGWPGIGGGTLIGPMQPGGPPTFRNGGTGYSDPTGLGIPVDDWPPAKQALEDWTNSPINWENLDPN